MKDTLKYLRIQNNFSQNKVGDYLGISRQMYIKYEAGETEPSVKCVRELCRLYKVSYDVLIDDKYKEEAEKLTKKISKEATYENKPETVLEVHSSEPAYTASDINPDALNFRNVWSLLFKLNSEDLVRVATKALKLAERKNEKPVVEEMSMEEKMRLFNKYNGFIKDVKIEDWKTAKMKYLKEKYGL